MMQYNIFVIRIALFTKKTNYDEENHMDLTELKVLPHALYLKIYAEYFQNRSATHPIFYLKNNCPFTNIFFPEHLQEACSKRIVNGPKGLKMYPNLHQCAHKPFLVIPAERRQYLVVRETFEEMELILRGVLTAFGMRIAEEPRLYRLLLAHFGYNCSGIRTSIFELVAALERMLWQSDINLIRNYRALTRDPVLYEKIFFALEKAKKVGDAASLYLSCTSA